MILRLVINPAQSSHAAEKKSPRPGRAARLKELDFILASIKGEPDYTFDHLREDERRFTPRILSVSADREVFNRLAVKDFLYLKSLPIQADSRILPLLLPQSICGRAQNGHGMFYDETGRSVLFPEATIEDVILALGSDELGVPNHLIKVLRQQILDDLQRFLLESLARETITFGSALTGDRNPFGITFLEGVSVESLPFFKGFVLGGIMDNWRDRLRTARHFQVTLKGEPLILGGGESLLTDREKFTQTGLTEQLVAGRVFSEEELRYLRELEVIVPENRNDREPKPVGIFYRRMPGPGVSDDAAIVYLGKTYGRDAMYGVLLADAADTYDKFVETYAEGGHDEKLVRLVSSRLARDGEFVSGEEIRRMIYFSAKANDPPLDISSSHRRLIQVESGAKVPTFLNHLEYVEGRKPARIPLGYNRVDSEKFYNGVSQRAEILRLSWNAPAVSGS